ncbi:MAG TPA: ATP-binding cassette domain-containing protein [Rhodospirillales bacterium]|nr:ATP-binding cassette domain-containing protein [Rhodospirillales bacterium]
MLKLENITFQYAEGSHITDYRFDLSVGAGEIAGLTGRSGSGKSTCLDIITGFLSPGEGRIMVDGRDIALLAPGRRPVTVLFQNNNLFDHLSAHENVALGINPSLRLNKAEKITIDEALVRVGLDGLADNPAHQLSGGEQQRVALARSLVANRSVLLLDEPFNALDREVRQQMLELVRGIVSDKNLATLMVTHDINDCDKIADKHYHLSNGEFHLTPG